MKTDGFALLMVLACVNSLATFFESSGTVGSTSVCSCENCFVSSSLPGRKAGKAFAICGDAEVKLRIDDLLQHEKKMLVPPEISK